MQLYDGGVWVGAGEVEEEFGAGAGEGVDGLVCVTDDGDVVPVAQPCGEDSLLEGGDVLVFVDDKGAVLGPEFFGDGGGVFDGPGNVEEEVVEVEEHDIGVDFGVFVTLVDLRDDGGWLWGVAVSGFCHVLFGADEPGFGPFDFAEDIAQVFD